MCYVVQIFVPLADNAGLPFPDEVLRRIQKDLYDHFGGLTAYNRAPAEGVWRGGGAETKDDLIIVEVMADKLDRDWWRDFRTSVERLLKQDELVVRAHAIERL
jgi:hypothetical protein